MTDYAKLAAEADAAADADDRKDPIAECGLAALTTGCDLGDVAECLRKLAGRLNGADPLDRRTLRNRAIGELKRARVTDAAGLVDAALGGGATGTRPETGQGQTVTLQDPEPAAERQDGAALLADLARTYARFLALPDGGVTALALWTLHAHAHDAALVSPLLVLTSPEKRCGKSTTLKLLGALVPRPLPAASISPAALFRCVERFRPTLLLDEAETAFRASEELRAIVNAAHDRAGAVTLRTVGDDHEPRTFSTWCAKAVALIGNLPGTLTDRAVVLSMRRRRKDETVERLRLDRLGELEPLRRRSARWARDTLDALRDADAEVPAELHDRAADNWRPLLAIADAAGGPWPERARKAARVLSGGEEADDAPRVLLLGDLRALFAARDADRLATSEILDHLHGLETSPWPEWGRSQKPISARQLARLLGPVEVRPRAIRTEAGTPRGYLLSDFADAFSRYLPPLEVQHPQQGRNDGKKSDSAIRNTAPFVADAKTGESPMNPGHVADVADREGGAAGEGPDLALKAEVEDTVRGRPELSRPDLLDRWPDRRAEVTAILDGLGAT